MTTQKAQRQSGSSVSLGAWRKVNFIRRAAYVSAMLFMTAMAVNGIFASRLQLLASASKTADYVAASLAIMPHGQQETSARSYQALIDIWSSKTLTFQLLSPSDTVIAATSSAPPDQGSLADATRLTKPIGNGELRLVSTVHRSPLLWEAIGQNLISILFILILGLPVLISFFYLRKTMHHPTYHLLEYAQSSSGDTRAIPDLPAMWQPVLERLAELKSTRARFEALFESAPIPISLFSPEAKLVAVNPACARYFDLAPQEMVALDPEGFKKYYPGLSSQSFSSSETFAKTIQTMMPQTANGEMQRLDGRIVQTRATAFPVVDANNQLVQVCVFTEDLTAQLQAESELEKRRRDLVQAEKLASLGSMLAGVSHELNNPLAAVIGQAAMLAEDVENTPHAERVKKIRRAAERCAKIVQSFLLMARQKAPEYQHVCPNDLIRAALDLTDFQMKAADVKVHVNLDPRLPQIEADPDQLHQVIVNLLSNARQSLEDLPSSREIHMTSDVSDSMIRIVVADNGLGIPADLRPRIFDPFFTTKDPGAGTGLGLPFSLSIVEAHGGTIRLDEAGAGASFTVLLPISSSNAGPQKLPDAAPTARVAAGRALIVDDEEDVADTLADMLERMDFTATVAIGGQAALAILAETKDFDMILSDVRMPDVDGPALHSWIAENAPHLLEKLAFVTGDTLSGQASDFLEHCGRPYLEKPFTPEALQALVAQMRA